MMRKTSRWCESDVHRMSVDMEFSLSSFFLFLDFTIILSSYQPLAGRESGKFFGVNWMWNVSHTTDKLYLLVFTQHSDFLWTHTFASVMDFSIIITNDREKRDSIQSLICRSTSLHLQMKNTWIQRCEISPSCQLSGCDFSGLTNKKLRTSDSANEENWENWQKKSEIVIDGTKREEKKLFVIASRNCRSNAFDCELESFSFILASDATLKRFNDDETTPIEQTADCNIRCVRRYSLVCCWPVNCNCINGLIEK